MNKKLFIVMPMLGIILPGLAGCGSSSTDDPNKANLHIVTLDKGIGTAWLENAARAFEELYAESEDFQPGRKGVKITVIGGTIYDGNYLNNNILNEDIYFTEQVEYRALVNKGKLLDITDALNADLSIYGDAEGKTILKKLDSTMENYLNVSNKYYGVPFYDAYYGLVYDVTLWKKQNLYLSNDPEDRFVPYGDENMTLGSDNIAGTPDDGLPATYEEFGILMTELKDRGIKPFVTAQNAKEYVADYLFNVAADYEGVDNMAMNITLSGTATDLIDNVDDAGNITMKGATEITQSNGYLLTRQAGRYHTLRFFKNYLINDTSNYIFADTHRSAQREFIQKNKATAPDVAMIVEGSWFENEAASIIAKEEAKSGKRDYAIMPIPFASEEKAAASNYKHTYLSLSQSFGVVSSNCSNKKLAKEFMKFLHSDKMLSKFTADTSITRPLNYEVSAEDQTKLSSYAKSLIYLKGHSNIVYPYSSLPIQVNNPSLFKHHRFMWSSTVDNEPYAHPWDYFRLAKNPTVKKYFDGQYDRFFASWPK